MPKPIDITKTKVPGAPPIYRKDNKSATLNEKDYMQWLKQSALEMGYRLGVKALRKAIRTRLTRLGIQTAAEIQEAYIRANPGVAKLMASINASVHENKNQDKPVK